MNRRNPAHSRDYARIEGEVAYVTLTRGKVAVIDAADAEAVGRHLWHYTRDGYVQCRVEGRRTYLHRFLSNSGDLYVNHRNDDRLDNRRENLRPCTTADYTRNQKPLETRRGKPLTCRLKGVCWDRSRGKYLAQIETNERCRHLGYYADPVQAAHAYDAAAREHFGEFARLNFPEG